MCLKIDKIVKYLLLFTIFMMPQGASVLTFSVAGWSVTSFRLSLLLALSVLLSLCRESVFVSQGSSNYSIRFYFVWVMYALLSLLWVVDTTNWVRQYVYVVTGVLIAILALNYLKDEDDIYI